MGWPATFEDLGEEQRRLASLPPEPWAGDGPVGGVFVCFPRGGEGPGSAGDPAWAAAAIGGDGPVAVVTGRAGAPYRPGLLALREGPLLESAVRALPERPGVLIVNATGRDHPRRAGMALHLGAVLGTPSVGVTHRPLVGAGEWPGDRRGDISPILIDGETVAVWLRVQQGARPLVVHPGWRTDLDTAISVVLAETNRFRTPEPLRRAREAARTARALSRRAPR